MEVDYEYIFYTTDVGSYWMFDWGDGSYSNWIPVKSSDTFVSQTHSWKSPGIYNIRIKHNSTYIGESLWSQPLVVTIGTPSDLDNDGWNNDIEQAYGTNPQDSNDYPFDTDSDGIPDDDSSAESYTGDSDDDNDRLSDIIEELLGSDTKDNKDVISIVIGVSIYYLVDTDSDGKTNVLYNPQTEQQSNVYIEDGKICFDISGDSSWDYSYYNGAISIYKAPFPWLLLILLIILIVVIIIVLLFKMGILYLYEEESIVEK